MADEDKDTQQIQNPYAGYVTLREIGARFGIKYHVLIHWISLGLPSVKIGSSIIIDPDKFNAWKAEHVEEVTMYRVKDL